MVAKSEELTFENISAIEREEHRLQRLSKITKTFYEQLAGYLKDLEKDIESAKGKGEPYTKITMLHTEYKNIANIFKHIYENRTRKIVNLALTKAFGGKADTKNLLDCEYQFFEKLTQLLKEHHDVIFQYPAKKLDVALPSKTAKEESKLPPLQPPLPQPPQHLTGYVIIEVLTDLPTFAGLDRNYSLKKGDVLTIPEKIAEILHKRGKAWIINYAPDGI